MIVQLDNPEILTWSNNDLIYIFSDWCSDSPNSIFLPTVTKKKKKKKFTIFRNKKVDAKSFGFNFQETQFFCDQLKVLLVATNL